jgi:hypothetical protein
VRGAAVLPLTFAPTTLAFGANRWYRERRSNRYPQQQSGDDAQSSHRCKRRFCRCAGWTHSLYGHAQRSRQVHLHGHLHPQRGGHTRERHYSKRHSEPKCGNVGGNRYRPIAMPPISQGA